MGTSKVGIVVLNWNRPEDTLECLNSLLPNVQQRLATIICCDNGSIDGSVQTIIDWARRFFVEIELEPAKSGNATLLAKNSTGQPSFLLVETGVNLGYAGGNNVGIQYALACGTFDYIWILNNDTVVEPDALSALLAAAAASPELGALGSTIVDYDHPQRVQCAGGCRYFPALTITKPVHQGKDRNSMLQGSPEVHLDYISGAAMLVRTAIIREVGLFNEDYFLYYEEADYAKRLQRKGYRIGWCKESIVRHKGGVSTGSRSPQNPKGSWLSNYHENFSTLQYTASYYPLLLPLAALFRLLMKLVMVIILQRWYSFPPLLYAYRDFFFGTKKLTENNQHSAKPHILFRGVIESKITNEAFPLPHTELWNVNFSLH